MKIRVYFTSGCAADFEREKVTFGNLADWLQYKSDDGRTIINVDTVCFVRELPEKKEDGDE